MVMRVSDSSAPLPAETEPVVRGDHFAIETIGLTAADAAVLLGISESHFYCLHKTGRLGPLPVRMGRAVRWSRRELEEWFNSGSPARIRWQASRRNGKR